MKIVIPGGSGFLGKSLVKYFADQGHELVVLSRTAGTKVNCRCVSWDGQHMGPWADELEGADVVINLSGRSVNCRATPTNRRQMIDSRVFSTRVIGEAIQACNKPPTVWMNSSTATIYKHRFDNPNDEATGLYGPHPDAKDEYALKIANAWENAFENVTLERTRKIVLRTALVLGTEEGGVYKVLRRLVRLRLGGKMGTGKQLVSWIHSNDFCAIVDHFITNQDSEGIYNICSPNPLSNRDMMNAFRNELSVTIGLPANEWMLEIGAFFIRTETELIIKSRYVVPGRLLEENYHFKFPMFDQAIHDIEAQLKIRT
jgi:uncharacterized protein